MNVDCYRTDHLPAPRRVTGSPWETAADLAHRGGSLVFTLPPEATEDERAAQSVFLDDVAAELVALGRQPQTHRRRTRSGWEEVTLGC